MPYDAKASGRQLRPPLSLTSHCLRSLIWHLGLAYVDIHPHDPGEIAPAVLLRAAP